MDPDREPLSTRPALREGDPDAEFLAGYDPSRYPHPSVAVDVVLLTVVDRDLWVVLTRRAEPPAEGRLTLPGAFVGLHETPEQAAQRALLTKTGLRDVFTEQLYTFGAIDRDPRTRVISIAYYALIARDQVVIDGGAFRVRVPWSGETGGPVQVLDVAGTPKPLAFDHAEIIGAAVKRLRAKLWYAPVGFELLPPEFTLFDLQKVYEAVTGAPLDRDMFRKRILRSGLATATGTTRAAAYRAPGLYRFTGGAGA